MSFIGMHERCTYVCISSVLVTLHQFTELYLSPLLSMMSANAIIKTSGEPLGGFPSVKGVNLNCIYWAQL